MMKRVCILFVTAALISGCGVSQVQAKDEDKMYQYSTTLETEKPEMNETTKQLVAAYHKSPTQENYDKLRNQVEINYEKVLDKKRAKLQELKETAKEQSKITEMEQIVNEMIEDRDNRINQTMSRLTDSRLGHDAKSLPQGYVPVMGAGENIYISALPVTNKDYIEFINETGYPAPVNWSNGMYPDKEEDFPVTYVSYADCLAYCEWMNEKTDQGIYRLPSETEWELAAGHMPKDAAMNAGKVEAGITSVYAYSDTLGASGAIDMWGNVWEWTSTPGSTANTAAVKGGSWDSPKTDCRTEYREESRYQSSGYDNVGFRLILEQF